MVQFRASLQLNLTGDEEGQSSGGGAINARVPLKSFRVIVVIIVIITMIII